METTDRVSERASVGEPEGSEQPRICAYSTSEERTVFTESGNWDGWIATDVTVDPTQ